MTNSFANEARAEACKLADADLVLCECFLELHLDWYIYIATFAYCGQQLGGLVLAGHQPMSPAAFARVVVERAADAWTPYSQACLPPMPDWAKASRVTRGMAQLAL